ncbi:MAG: FAD-dependent oxidoreductase, partial [Marinoscillum sp.]
MLSIWERESFINFDVIIVGAGISGLSTAASLKEKIPGLDILVLERGTLPTGASTKNAGFACFGSVSELAQDRKIMGDDQMIELVSKRWSGL